LGIVREALLPCHFLEELGNDSTFLGLYLTPPYSILFLRAFPPQPQFLSTKANGPCYHTPIFRQFNSQWGTVEPDSPVPSLLWRVETWHPYPSKFPTRTSQSPPSFISMARGRLPLLPYSSLLTDDKNCVKSLF